MSGTDVSTLQEAAPGSRTSAPARLAPTARPSLAALTGLRFVAAFGVVLFHFDRSWLTSWQPLKNIVAGGFSAVSLFFLLSGFILAYTYLSPAGTLVGTRRNFWVSRFARIYPAYLLAFLLAAPTAITISLRVNTLHAAVLKLTAGALAVLTLQQSWTPLTAWAWNFPAWSVSVEAFFYLLFPFLGPRLARLRGRAAVRMALVLWVLLMVPPFVLLAVKGFTGPPAVGDYLQMAVEFTPLLRVPEFALGILLGCAFTHGELSRLRGQWIAPATALAITGILACSPFVPHTLLASGLLTPFFAVLLASLAQDEGAFGRALSRPVTVLLGEASYGIYILQLPIGFVLGMAPPLFSVPNLVVYYLALITASLLSLRLVEVPLRVRIKRWLGEPRDVRREQLSRKGQCAAAPDFSAGPSETRRALLVGTGTLACVAAVDSVAQWRLRRGSAVVSPDAVDWVSTTRQRSFASQALRPAGERWAALELEVFPERPLQTIDGFGGCFNEMGWDALQHLSPADRNAVLAELFAPGVGANLNLCRLPIGANDFANGWYSLDEVPGDFDLAHFSIDRDQEALIPFIHSAQAHNPALRLWACPWSPPSWMKRNGFYAQAKPAAGQAPTGIQAAQIAEDGTEMFILEEPFLRAYANYFGRFVDAYREQGIRIGMVMPQNEFNSAQPYPSCTWTPEGLAEFLEYLGPAMSARGVEVFLGTLEKPDPQLARKVLRKPGLKPFLDGVGVQWAGRPAAADLHGEFPKVKIMQTEQECGDSRNTWRYCLYCWQQMRESFEGGANSYMYWNLALPTGGTSHWGWRQNSLITVDPAAGSFHFNHEFTLLKHVSHFVQPGARRLPTRSFAGDALAFLNPDRSVAVILHNPLPVGRPLDILIGHRRVEGWMEPDSFNTVLLRA